ncbi:hypothetical protein BHM03_00060494 [Ensete ventricosum]|nr:hypothetical protein BHM03_00060494 [Ensete ventricosum]
MPKMSSGKAPSTRAVAPAREVGVSRAREAPKTSSKRPMTQLGDTRRPAAPSEEPDTPIESDEGGASPVHHRPRSLKDLFKMKVHKDDARYYTLQMSELRHQDLDKEMKARWRGLKNSTKVWNDSSIAEEFERGLLHPQLARELYTLPSEVLLARAAKEMVLMALFDQVHDTGRLITFMDYRISQLQQELDTLKSDGGPEAVAKVKERASELGQELEKTKRERDEALLQLEASKKDLSEVQSNLAKRHRSLYSESNRVSVPESLIFFITYHTAAPHHVVRGPCDEARACRSTSPCRLSHVGGPVVRDART